jgi:hypothetical protein
MTDAEKLAAIRALLAHDDDSCTQRRHIVAEVRRILEGG